MNDLLSPAGEEQFNLQSIDIMSDERQEDDEFGEMNYGSGQGMRLMKVMKILPNKKGGPLRKSKEPIRLATREDSTNDVALIDPSRLIHATKSTTTNIIRGSVHMFEPADSVPTKSGNADIARQMQGGSLEASTK